MVRDFQYVSPEVFSRLGQMCLGFPVDIPGEEESVIFVSQLQDDGAVIGLGPRISSVHRPVSGWVEHLHLHAIYPPRR